MTFGQNIKQLRTRMNLSQRAFARLVDVSQSSIKWYEEDKVAPSATTLERLADLIGVSMDELWRGDRVGADGRPFPKNQTTQLTH